MTTALHKIFILRVNYNRDRNKRQEYTQEKAPNPSWRTWGELQAFYTPLLKLFPQGKIDPNWPQHFIPEITKPYSPLF